MFAWNTIGSVCNAASSFLLLIFVTRICGDYEAGIFALAFANAQLLLTIGKFGMRAYQSTDINSRISFSTYLNSRFITCFVMIITSILYTYFANYSIYNVLIFMSVSFIKMVDALEDVFHGLFQQKGRIDIAGKKLSIRNFITICLFILVLVITKSLLITCTMTALISLVICIVINLPIANHYDKVKIIIDKNSLFVLFKSCFPLFIGSFLSLFIYNIPKYTIDYYYEFDIQTYYSILFMPAFMINLVSDFIFRPLLTEIAVLWNQNKKRIFINYITKLLLGIIGITIIVVIGGYLIGLRILSILYGVNLDAYYKEFIVLLIGGGFSAGVYLLFNVLIAIRKHLRLVLGYSIGAIIGLILCPILVKNFSMLGASITYLSTSSIIFILFLMILIFAIIEKENA